MSTMKLSETTFRPHRASWWTRLQYQIVEWRRRVRSRHELMRLDDESLHDIGVSRCEAEFEASKPFWLA